MSAQRSLSRSGARSTRAPLSRGTRARARPLGGCGADADVTAFHAAFAWMTRFECCVARRVQCGVSVNIGGLTGFLQSLWESATHGKTAQKAKDARMLNAASRMTALDYEDNDGMVAMRSCTQPWRVTVRPAAAAASKDPPPLRWGGIKCSSVASEPLTPPCTSERSVRGSE